MTIDVGVDEEVVEVVVEVVVVLVEAKDNKQQQPAPSKLLLHQQPVAVDGVVAVVMQPGGDLHSFVTCPTVMMMVLVVVDH